MHGRNEIGGQMLAAPSAPGARRWSRRSRIAQVASMGPMRLANSSDSARCTSGGAYSHEMRVVSRGKKSLRWARKASGGKASSARSVATASGASAAFSSRRLPASASASPGSRVEGDSAGGVRHRGMVTISSQRKGGQST